MNLRRRQWLIVLAGMPLAGAARAQSQPGEPFRTVTLGGMERVMLEGHDPVAYFTQGAAIKGDAALQLDHAGVRWYFASAAHKVAFERNPVQYMPQFGGYCGNGINYAIPGGGGGGPNTWRIYLGRLYVFGGQSARDHFEMDTELNIRRAQQYWDAEVAGSNPQLQRLQRMIFRVPHYLSDAALQAQWEAKRAAGTLPVMPGAPQVVPAAAA
jgi:YHS domain-containing protein